jgi:hypothetical protein
LELVAGANLATIGSSILGKFHTTRRADDREGFRMKGAFDFANINAAAVAALPSAQGEAG